MIKLEAENLQLKGDIDSHNSRNTILQELLNQANKKSEERENRYLEVYQEKLSLESSLESTAQGDLIQKYEPCGLKAKNFAHDFDSTDVFHKTRQSLEAERKTNAELTAELSKVKLQLKAANKSCESLNPLLGEGSETCANFLAASLGDKHEPTALAMNKKNQSTALMEPRQENEQSISLAERIEDNLHSYESLLSDNSNDNGVIRNNLAATELKETLREVARAAAASSNANKNVAGSQAFDSKIDSIAEMLMKDREGLARSKEVHKTKSFSQAFADIELHDLSPLPNRSNSQSILKRLSRLISKADNL